MEALTSFRSFKLAPVPIFIEYGIYAVLAILVFFILRNGFKKNEAESRVLSFYKVIVVALFGNFLLNIIFSCAFALYFIVFNPKYEAEVVDSVTHIEQVGSKVNQEAALQYPIFELKTSSGKVIRAEGNEGVLGSLIIGEQATIAFKDGQLFIISIFSILMYILILLISSFVLCVLLYWSVFVF